MLPKSWQPKPAAGMVRLGPALDGGYVVARRAIDRTELLLSMGLGSEWGFEEDFLRVSRARVICFDATVDDKFWQLFIVKKLLRLRPLQAMHYYCGYRRFFYGARAEHRKVMIGYDGPGSVSLATLLRDTNSRAIFLKIDIEGWEHRILEQIVAAQDRFTGIVMELHDVDLQRERIDAFLHQLTEFEIVHLNPNNIGGMDPARDPLVLEISLMRPGDIQPTGPTDPLWVSHPVTNDVRRPPIELHFG